MKIEVCLIFLLITSVILIVGSVLIDISEAKRLKEELKEQEEKNKKCLK